MQPKNPTSPRQGTRPRPTAAAAVVKSPRRPVGVQMLGPLHYAQLRQALHQLASAEAR